MKFKKIAVIKSYSLTMPLIDISFFGFTIIRFSAWKFMDAHIVNMVVFNFPLSWSIQPERNSQDKQINERGETK